MVPSSNVLREAFEGYVFLNTFLEEYGETTKPIKGEWAALLDFVTVQAIDEEGPG